MIYFAKNSGQKPGTASLEYPLFHGSLPPYGYQAVTNVDFAGLNDYFYSPTGWETFSLWIYGMIHRIDNTYDTCFSLCKHGYGPESPGYRISCLEYAKGHTVRYSPS